MYKSLLEMEKDLQYKYLTRKSRQNKITDLNNFSLEYLILRSKVHHIKSYLENYFLSKTREFYKTDIEKLHGSWEQDIAIN